MKQTCAICKTNGIDKDDQLAGGIIAGAVCRSCEGKFNWSSGAVTLKELADSLDAPVLVMQAEPRQVYTANSKALELFNKELDRVEKHRGGQVFDCVYAFTEAGCGKDVHCQPCKIKNAIVETLSTGRPLRGVSALLDIKKRTGTSTYMVQISTEKIGHMAIVRMDRYEPAT